MSLKMTLTEHKCDKTAEISEIHTIVKRLDKKISGNGNPGMYEEFQQTKGAVKFMKWIVGSGFIASIIALISSIKR